MTDILERIEAERDALAIDPMRPANPILKEAAEEIRRLRKALQKIADLPPPERAVRLIKKSCKHIAIRALQH